MKDKELIKRLVLIVEDNISWGGSHSNKRAMMRIKKLLEDYKSSKSTIINNEKEVKKNGK